jgi:acyl carrier protein
MIAPQVLADSASVPPTDDPRADKILDIVAKETRVARADLRLDVRTDDLGISSLDLTMAVFEIESYFKIEIPIVAGDTDAEFVTVGALLRHVLAVLDRTAHATPGAAAAGA